MDFLLFPKVVPCFVLGWFCVRGGLNCSAISNLVASWKCKSYTINKIYGFDVCLDLFVLSPVVYWCMFECVHAVREIDCV